MAPGIQAAPVDAPLLAGLGEAKATAARGPFPPVFGVGVRATLACLTGDVAVGVAMLVAYDCWLRISEVSGGITAAGVHDTRAQVDPVGRGVSIFLSGTKTGRRQGVMVAWHYSWYLFLLCPPVSC